MDYRLNASKRERTSCVRLSESVPALAIKSGRGGGEALVLKCSSRRVGFCLLRADSEHLLSTRSTVFATCSSYVSRTELRFASARFGPCRCRRGDRALSHAELGGKTSRPQLGKIFSDANKVKFASILVCETLKD